MGKEKSDKLHFEKYRPKDGYIDFKQCQQEALELLPKLLPVIQTDKDLTYRDKVQNAYRKAFAVKKMVNNLLENRRRFYKGDHALRPLYSIWTLLNACNFRCTYCDNHQGEHYFDVADNDRLDTQQGKALLQKLLTGSSALYWCGGEPTMRKDLPELLDHAWHLGFFPNMINTNGSLLHKLLQKPQWSRFLWQMDVIIVSLDGLNLGRLKELWGVKKPEQVATNLLLLKMLHRHVKFKLAVNTVITSDTIEEASDILDLAADLDIWFVPVPVNYKHEPNKELLENERYRSLANLILERKKKGQKIIGSHTLLRRLLFAEPYQCLTALKPHIWSNGKIAWPCRASINTSPANINLLDYDSFDEAYRAGAKRVNPNFFHGPADNQCGGQCAWMQNYTTARYMDGIIHPLSSGFMSDIYEFITG